VGDNGDGENKVYDEMCERVESLKIKYKLLSNAPRDPA
jgi:hypothetical protein